jgi:LysR family transcriptional activator of nhaA
MEWLNYHHLLYFWTVAREGTISRACKQLRLAQPTISAQLKALEEQLGEPLFDRRGRNLVLTPTGHVVFKYADNIFSLGRELMDVLKGRPTGKPLALVIGIADVVPKLVAYHLIEPALKLPEPVKVVCREDRTEQLIASLAINEVNLVIADSPLPPTSKVKAFNHLLGESGISFFAKPSLAKKLSKDFPLCLNGAPVLLPTENTSLRRSLDLWFDNRSISPDVVGEFQDSALLKMFGKAGVGAFPAPTVMEADLIANEKVVVIGRTNDIRERYYAISVERKLKHPAIVAISQAARNNLFA